MDKKIAKAEQLKKLYDLAYEFEKLRCWEYMDDTDLFGVMRPSDGLIAYVCILGAAGEVFGLNAYLGSQGLQVVLDMMSGKIQKENPEISASQYCLALSYEQDDLYFDKRDKMIQKELGIASGPEKPMPFFRSFIPSYFPWHFTEEEAAFMETIVEQSIGVCRRFKKNPDLFQTDREGHYFVRKPYRRKNHIVWKDQFIKAEPYQEKWEHAPVNEVKMKKILKKKPRREGFWEIGCDFFPLRIGDGKSRPQMPLVFLALDAKTGKIIGHSVSSLRKKNLLVGEEILNLISKHNTIPVNLIVSNRNLKKILEPLSQRLDMTVRFRRKPMYYQNAANEMIDYLNRGPQDG